MAGEQLEEGLENMGLQMKGFIKKMEKDGRGFFGYITAEDGRDYFFPAFSFPSFNPDDKSTEQTNALRNEFLSLPEKAKVTFTLADTSTGREAHNVVLDTSEEVDTLIPEVKSAASKALESVENMGPQMKGATERINHTQGYWHIVDENGKSYYFRFVDCIDGIDTFNELKDGMSVTFNERTQTLKGEIKENSWLAMNIAIDTSK